MITTVLGTRRKPKARDGANRKLVTIPKGMLAQAHSPAQPQADPQANPMTRETALSAVAASEDARVQKTHFRSGPGLVLLNRSCRGDENRPMDENRKLREYLAPLFDALPCGVLLADSENRLRMANAEACRMLLGDAPGGVSGAAKPAGVETELARVLKTIADSGTRFFELGAAQRRRLLKVTRICLSAEQGLAADRVYLLQAAAGIRRAETKKETGATA